MPKYSISDIHKRTVELDEGLLEMHKRQLEHERKLNSANGTAIAVDMGTGSGSNSGIATVTFTPGVSLGLVIALGA